MRLVAQWHRDSRNISIRVLMNCIICSVKVPCVLSFLIAVKTSPTAMWNIMELRHMMITVSQQAEWLKVALQSDLYKNAPFKVIVCHMPPFGGWHGERDIARKFIPLLNVASPDVYLCAHLHLYERNEAGKDGVGFPLIVNSNNTLLKSRSQQQRNDDLHI